MEDTRNLVNQGKRNQSKILQNISTIKNDKGALKSKDEILATMNTNILQLIHFIY